MWKENKKQFTIGQFAALHEINKKTLMWYDEIGLLKPQTIRENGYRCYSYQQSAQLETILMLRELNVSLEEIQTFMGNRSIQSFEKLLGEKQRELEETIAHLQAVRENLMEKQENMQMLRTLDLSAIDLVSKPRRYLVAVEGAADLPFEQAAEQVIAQGKKYQLRRLRDATYGAMIPVEQLLQGNFENYSALYIQLPSPIAQQGLHVQPEGTYLRAFSQGSWEKIPDKYRQMLAYAKAQGLVLKGWAYETGINELVIHSMEEYITQIEIPVEVPSPQSRDCADAFGRDIQVN